MISQPTTKMKFYHNIIVWNRTLEWKDQKETSNFTTVQFVVNPFKIIGNWEAMWEESTKARVSSIHIKSQHGKPEPIKGKHYKKQNKYILKFMAQNNL